jgi:RNA polymerase sigma-70 factor, ECF subfamily
MALLRWAIRRISRPISKISEHFAFSGSLSLQEGSMAAQAMAGESVLKTVKAIDREAAQGAVTDVESLVSQHTPMVFRVAYSILRNHHDAEDAAQECFLKVLKLVRKSKTGMAEVRNTKTWLARVAWTTALDRRSRRASVAGHEFVIGEGEAASESGAPLDVETVADFRDTAAAPDEVLASRDMQSLLQKMIVTLPEDLRQPLELSTVRELNSAEIAEVMGIPEGSVRTRLMRARKLLKEKMATLMEVKKHD